MAGYRKSHERAWRYLLEDLQPDVALVQEALVSVAGSAAGSDRLTWHSSEPCDAGTAVFVNARLRDVSRVMLTAEGSYMAAVKLDDRRPVLISSVHVGPEPDYVQNLNRVIEALTTACMGQSFVVGGDFNAARHYDEVYKRRRFRPFFDDMQARGFCDCHWTLHGRETQTFWGRQAKNPYQCDHFFADPTTLKSIRRCEVIEYEPVREYSDHAPIQLTIEHDS
jgi:endonuclease/exonuclease/phosphatase family metal-dependent hydrolase